MDNDDSKQISGLSFRSMGSDFESVELGSSGPLGSIRKRIIVTSQKIRAYLVKRNNPLSFIYDFGVYLAVRFRIIGIILSVLAEVVMEYTDELKKFAVKHMFWGRGGVFKFFMQIVSFSLFLIIFIVYAYKAPSIQADFVGATVAGSSVVREDLLVQTGQTSTQVPENRGRTESDKYIVKSGDTLSKIASFYGITSDTLRWVNDLSEANLIRPGDELIIPPGDGVLVTVKDGDDIEGLADKYRSNPQLIIENDYNVSLFPPEYTLAVGMELFIPDGKPPEPPKKQYSPPKYTAIAYTPPSTNYGVTASRFLSWPVAGSRGRLTQCYSGWHNGIDIADRGMPDLVASADGVVTFAGCQSGSCPPPGVQIGGYGLAWTVMIDHGNGFQSIYAHMNKIYVRSGQAVSRGQALGQMGQSGTAYGTHIHFMLIQGGGWKWINPAPYMTTSICGY